ncbi:MAG: ATP-binding protein [Gemmatimonadetes bacterium]|nr:ATP-binding protein [Gemmatimonadota bacterium]
MTESPPYKMTISLDVLRHLGIGLYSNIPAVLSELVANAWDADATQVEITLDHDTPAIAIRDNGHGMSQEHVNEKFLTIGYRRRLANATTPRGRNAMGRKGIGKLAAFSIADTVEVHTADGETASAFRMDTDAIKEAATDPKKPDYFPAALPAGVPPSPPGTLIRLTNLRKKLAWAAPHLRRRLARRFSVIGPSTHFRVAVNGEPITIADRDYFKDMEFIWHFGEQAADWDFSKAPSGANAGVVPAEVILEPEDGEPPVTHTVRGFIGTVTKPGKLDDVNNAIVLSARGRLIHEDMLPEYRQARVYTEYVVGEVIADFLDDDDSEDIVTSGRQRVQQDDTRYIAVKEVVSEALRQIRDDWDGRRKKKGKERALEYPSVQQWYTRMGPDKRRTAARMFGKIEALRLDEDEPKYQLYRASMLAFEKLALKDMLSALDDWDPLRDNGRLLELMAGVDEIEATSYRDIVEGRLSVIEAFRNLAPHALEATIRDYIFEHLWLLHPSWDRATSDAHMEETVAAEFKKVRLTEEEKRARIDIRYRTTAGKHVIIELKKYSVSVNVFDLAKQLEKYRRVLGKCLKQRFPEEPRHIECVSILGKPPTGDNVARTLLANEARFITYDQLILEARRSYAQYLKAKKGAQELSRIIDDMRADFGIGPIHAD